MLDKFDEVDKGIFKKDYTWFDPCAGMGNFHIMIYKRLIKYHKHDDIINKMFYANEINKKNVFLYKLIFGENANINCGDSLKLSNELKYDIIIGNPPYNSGTKNTGNTVYQEFIKKFINQYNKYFSFINPSGWRKPNTDKCKNYGFYDLMTKENHLIYLEIHDAKDGMKTFNAGTRYDWFIIDKDTNNKKNIIKGIDKTYKINCANWKFLPNGQFNIIKNIIDTTFKNNLDVIYSRNMYSSENVKKNKSLSLTKDKTYKYPIIYSINQKGIRYMYSNENKGMIGDNKIIFNKINVKNNLNYNKELYGLSEMCIGIKYDDDEIGEENINTLNNNKFQEIMKCFYFSQMTFDWRIFTYFNKDFYKNFH